MTATAGQWVEERTPARTSSSRKNYTPVSQRHPRLRDILGSAAKVGAGDAAYRASRVALQVHGAIGYTREHDLSLWITKVRALVGAWGTAAFHRRRVLENL